MFFDEVDEKADKVRKRSATVKKAVNRKAK